MSDRPVAMHRAGSPAWLAKTIESPIDPVQPIIDPHHHLWGPPRHPYLAEEMLADAHAGHHIVATVFSDCTEAYRQDGPEHLRPVGETEHMTGLARAQQRMTPADVALCAGIIGYADLRSGAHVRELLEAHIEAGQGRFRGIRQSSVWDESGEIRTTMRTPPRHMLRDPALHEGFAQLHQLGLSFDAWLYFHQLDDLAHLAERFPDANIILDHVGGVIGTGPYAGKRDAVFLQWREGITRLAQHENVSVKLGGLGMPLCGFGFEDGAEPPSSAVLADAWRPYIETCIDTFGPHRAMFESNFPVDQASGSYTLVWNAFQRIGAGYTATERQALFHDTAARVYRLDDALTARRAAGGR